MIVELKTYKIACDGCKTELIVQVEEFERVYPYDWDEVYLESWDADKLGVPQSSWLPSSSNLICVECKNKIRA